MADQKQRKSRGDKNMALSLLLAALFASGSFIPVLAEQSAPATADATTLGKDARASAEDAKALDQAAKAIVKDEKNSAKRNKDKKAKDAKAAGKDADSTAKEVKTSTKGEAKPPKEDKTSAKEDKKSAKEDKSSAKEDKKSAKEDKSSAKEDKKSAKAPKSSDKGSQAANFMKRTSVKVASSALGTLGGMPVCWIKRIITDEFEGVHDMTTSKSPLILVTSGILYWPIAAVSGTCEGPFYALKNAAVAKPFTKEQFSLRGD